MANRSPSPSTTSPRELKIDLYGKQVDFIQAREHFTALNGGIGSGKSEAGAIKAVLAALGTIGPHKIKTPNMGMVTAPTYPMLQDATLRTFRDRAGDLITGWNKSDRIATFANGSEIIFRTADNPDRLRGPNLTWWWGDEAAYYDALAWRVMIGRLRQHGAQGFAWLTTTPKGRNWVYQEFVQQERADYRIFNLKTRENPFLSEAFVTGLEQSYTGDFARQELEGDFVAFEGLVYPEFRRDVHITTDTPVAALYIAGVDWGYANPGVILVGAVDGDGRLTIVHEEYQRQRRVEEWAQVAQQIQATYRVQTFYCDPAEPDFIQQFVDAGVYAVQANNEVLTGLQAVKNRLVRQGDGRPRLMLSSEAVHTAIEFEQYQWMTHKDGIRDVVRKANDHALDALRYLVMGVDTMYGAMSEGAINYAADDISTQSLY